MTTGTKWREVNGRRVYETTPKFAECHTRRLHKARGMCQACYQQHLYKKNGRKRDGKKEREYTGWSGDIIVKEGYRDHDSDWLRFSKRDYIKFNECLKRRRIPQLTGTSNYGTYRAAA